jgi:hypothetical protein
MQVKNIGISVKRLYLKQTSDNYFVLKQIETVIRRAKCTYSCNCKMSEWMSKDAKQY